MQSPLVYYLHSYEFYTSGNNMPSASDSPWYGQPSVPILRPQMIKWFHLKGITTKANDVWICHNWHVTGWYHIWIWNTTLKSNYRKLENDILHTCNMCMCLVFYLLLNRIIAWSLIEFWLRSWTCFTFIILKDIFSQVLQPRHVPKSSPTFLASTRRLEWSGIWT